MKVQELGADGVCGTASAAAARRGGRAESIPGETAVAGRESQVGGELSCQLLPLVPMGKARDPQPAAPPEVLRVPGFSHTYTTAIHFMQQNKPF